MIIMPEYIVTFGGGIHNTTTIYIYIYIIYACDIQTPIAAAASVRQPPVPSPRGTLTDIE